MKKQSDQPGLIDFPMTTASQEDEQLPYPTRPPITWRVVIAGIYCGLLSVSYILLGLMTCVDMESGYDGNTAKIGLCMNVISAVAQTYVTVLLVMRHFRARVVGVVIMLLLFVLPAVEGVAIFLRDMSPQSHQVKDPMEFVGIFPAIFIIWLLNAIGLVMMLWATKRQQRD